MFDFDKTSELRTIFAEEDVRFLDRKHVALDGSTERGGRESHRSIPLLHSTIAFLRDSNVVPKPDRIRILKVHRINAQVTHHRALEGNGGY
jgi:ABC-type transport system involved in Fe-S cluster assembly fused permease/ATPase subunit